MMYYNSTTNTRYTASQLERRDLLLSDDDLKSIGIYKLTTEQSHYSTEYQQLTNERVEGDADAGFKLVWDVEYLPLEQVQRAKQRELTTAYDEFLKTQLSEYPEMERGTWDVQRLEAKELLADADAPALLVRSIASARGIEPVELARRIQKKVAVWSKLAGRATGQCQALQNKAAEAESPEEVLKIVADYSVQKSSAEDE